MPDFKAAAARLRSEASAIEEEISALGIERKSLALAAANQEKAAMSRVAVLNAGHLERLLKFDLLQEAAIEADRLAGDAERASSQRAIVAQWREAESIAQLLLACSAVVDAGLAGVAEALGKRRALALRLSGLGFGGRLVRPIGPTAAAQHAGLGAFLDLPRGDPRARRPLVESDATLIGHLLGAAPDEVATEEAVAA